MRVRCWACEVLDLGEGGEDKDKVALTYAHYRVQPEHEMNAKRETGAHRAAARGTQTWGAGVCSNEHRKCREWQRVARLVGAQAGGSALPQGTCPKDLACPLACA